MLKPDCAGRCARPRGWGAPERMSGLVPVPSEQLWAPTSSSLLVQPLGFHGRLQPRCRQAALESRGESCSLLEGW